jgi:hypothetical protein
MNVQVTEEAFSSLKRPSNTSNMNYQKIFLLLWVIFALLDPDPLTRLNLDPIRIPIRNPDGGWKILEPPERKATNCIVNESA